MKLEVKRTMLETMQDVIDLLPPSVIKEAIATTMSSKKESFTAIEAIFRKICSKKYPDKTLSFFLNGWKATHLKMLPIYGLSCRLDTLAFECKNPNQKLDYLEASAFNASTSHEDLGLGFDAISHGRLYDEFAYAMLKSDEWKLSCYDTKEANEFSEWVYRSMLLNAIPYALCINMVSEFYNHAEYAYSYQTFKYSMEKFYDLEGNALEDAIRYIDVHNQYETEIHHFLAVLNAMQKYEDASGEKITKELIVEVINTYVDLILVAFESISKKFGKDV
ncbi:MAG: hypothetical protein H6Q35_660 [Proteobacteria bacterium]|nr:hypothetical protein [Pseudomonadota bacterium]